MPVHRGASQVTEGPSVTKVISGMQKTGRITVLKKGENTCKKKM